MEKVRCNLCGSGDGPEVYGDGDLRYTMCDNCTLVYLNPRPTEEEYKRFYNKSYQSSRHNVTEYDQAVERLKRKKSYKNKEDIAKDFRGYISSNSTVLEIGSGWGTLLRVIKDKFGCEVFGVEISELGARVAQRYYNLDVFNMTIEDYWFFHIHRNERKFSFIMLMHVLEHFLDPVSLLVKISDLLTSDGLLYLVVPNIASPDEALNRYFHFEHCYYFTPLTLNNLLRKAGLKIIKMTVPCGEIKVFVAREEYPAKEVDICGFDSVYSKKNVLRAIERQNTKYKILRFFKKISEKILPRRISFLVKGRIIKWLRKLRIIGV